MVRAVQVYTPAHRYSPGYTGWVDCISIIVELELCSAETPAGSFRSALGPAFRTFRPKLLPSAVGEPLDPSRRGRKAACALVGGTERLLGLRLRLRLMVRARARARARASLVGGAGRLLRSAELL